MKNSKYSNIWLSAAYRDNSFFFRKKNSERIQRSDKPLNNM